MARPTDPLAWATDETGIVVPDPSKIAEGWNVGEKPPAQFFNYWQNLAGKWITALVDELDTLVYTRIEDLETRTAKTDESNTWYLPQDFGNTSPGVPFLQFTTNGANTSPVSAFRALMIFTMDTMTRKVAFWSGTAVGAEPAFAVTVNSLFHTGLQKWQVSDKTKPAYALLLGGNGALRVSQVLGNQADFTAWPTAAGLLEAHDITVDSIGATDGSMAVVGAVAATGNVSAANLSTAGTVTATGSVSGGNLSTGGNVSATGNVTCANLTATTDITAGAAGKFKYTGSPLRSVQVDIAHAIVSADENGSYASVPVGQTRAFALNFAEDAVVGTVKVKLGSGGYRIDLFKKLAPDMAATNVPTATSANNKVGTSANGEVHTLTYSGLTATRNDRFWVAVNNTGGSPLAVYAIEQQFSDPGPRNY